MTGGFGAGGILVNIKNNSEVNDIRFDPQRPIPAGDERAYGVAHAIFDLGLSYKFVASSRRGEERGRFSGFMFGIDAGAYLGVRMDEWRYEGEATGRIPSADNYFNPYIRMTIGGGGFTRAVE